MFSKNITEYVEGEVKSVMSTCNKRKLAIVDLKSASSMKMRSYN